MAIAFHARGRVRGPALAVCWCSLLFLHATARAEDEGPYFEAGSLPRPSYELRLSLRYHDATRTTFAVPVFLFAQPVQRIHARELLASFDLRLAITPALAVQAIVPLAARWADARLEGLLVCHAAVARSRSALVRSWGSRCHARACVPILTRRTLRCLRRGRHPHPVR
jgi:hypothetical protein